MTKQIAYSFDKETVRKIVRSLWIGAFAPAVVVLLQQLGSIHFHTDYPSLDVVLIYAIPILINGTIEWVRGKSKP